MMSGIFLCGISNEGTQRSEVQSKSFKDFSCDAQVDANVMTTFSCVLKEKLFY